MNKSDYDQKMLDILSDTMKFVKRDGNTSGWNQNKDITIFREEQIQRYLYSLYKKGVLDEDIYHQVKPQGSVPARLYGLPKLHKLSARDRITVPHVVPPHRPIISSIGAYNYNLAKHLKEMLSPHIPTNHCATDTFKNGRAITGEFSQQILSIIQCCSIVYNYSIT